MLLQLPQLFLQMGFTHTLHKQTIIQTHACMNAGTHTRTHTYTHTHTHTHTHTCTDLNIQISSATHTQKNTLSNKQLSVTCVLFSNKNRTQFSAFPRIACTRLHLHTHTHTPPQTTTSRTHDKRHH